MDPMAMLTYDQDDWAIACAVVDRALELGSKPKS